MMGRMFVEEKIGGIKTASFKSKWNPMLYLLMVVFRASFY